MNETIYNTEKSSPQSKKQKTEHELLQQKLIESKIESVTAFGHKTRKLERITLSRRLNEVMKESLTLNQEVKSSKKKLKQYKKKRDSGSKNGIASDTDSDEDNCEYYENVLNVKKQMLENCMMEIKTLRKDINEIDKIDKEKVENGNNKRDKSKDEDDDNVSLSSKLDTND